jgi:hypothetical protein
MQIAGVGRLSERNPSHKAGTQLAILAAVPDLT